MEIANERQVPDRAENNLTSRWITDRATVASMLSILTERIRTMLVEELLKDDNVCLRLGKHAKTGKVRRVCYQPKSHLSDKKSKKSSYEALGTIKSDSGIRRSLKPDDWCNRTALPGSDIYVKPQHVRFLPTEYAVDVQPTPPKERHVHPIWMDRMFSLNTPLIDERGHDVKLGILSNIVNLVIPTTQAPYKRSGHCWAIHERLLELQEDEPPTDVLVVILEDDATCFWDIENILAVLWLHHHKYRQVHVRAKSVFAPLRGQRPIDKQWDAKIPTIHFNRRFVSLIGRAETFDWSEYVNPTTLVRREAEKTSSPLLDAAEEVTALIHGYNCSSVNPVEGQKPRGTFEALIATLYATRGAHTDVPKILEALKPHLRFSTDIARWWSGHAPLELHIKSRRQMTTVQEYCTSMAKIGILCKLTYG